MEASGAAVSVASLVTLKIALTRLVPGADLAGTEESGAAGDGGPGRQPAPERQRGGHRPIHEG